MNDRLSRLCLVGPMGAGKSTVGRHLAGALGRRFYDLDAILSKRAGATISMIFDIEGETGFRRRESVLLDEYTRLPDSVVATGGGCIILHANREMLRARAFVVYLETPVEIQLSRLRHDTQRPLLQAPDRRRRLETLAAERNPLYESVAHLVIKAEHASTAATCEHILSRLPDEIRPGAAAGGRQ